MAFKAFIQEDSNAYECKELPWADHWARTVDNPSDPKQVHWCKHYPKGIMVVTFVYKAYVNKGTEQYAHLAEALEVLVSCKDKGAQMLCSLNKNSKPVLGVDEDKPLTHWIRSEDKFVQVANEPIAETLSREHSNPLLAGRGVQATASAEKYALDSKPIEDDQIARARRGRKAG